MQPTEAGPKAAILRAEGWLLAGLNWALVLLLAAMVVTVSLQVATRYLFGLPLIWSEEVARLLFIALIFLGAAVLARKREHLAVTVLVDLLPDRGRHITDALANAIGLVCAYFLVQGGWATLAGEWNQRTPALQFPMGIIFSLILFSCSLLAAWLALNVLASLRLAALNLPHERGGIGTSPDMQQRHSRDDQGGADQ
jgi:TRAP-type C4-dicarboxylate transport system permease small subunit